MRKNQVEEKSGEYLPMAKETSSKPTILKQMVRGINITPAFTPLTKKP